MADKRLRATPAQLRMERMVRELRKLGYRVETASVQTV
jgi:hypothetical protein